MSKKHIAIINKPVGISSSDVVIKCRNAYSRAINHKIKCGHMGTLDPMASGILIIAFGNATRLFDFALKKEKTYTAKFVFGEERDTIDATGELTKTANLPKYQHIVDILPEFIGNIKQVPPKYSAVNINGRRAYDLARKGYDFDIKAKDVFIKDIAVVDRTLDGEYCKDITLSIICGGGTYIRSICRDIAESAGSVAYMSELVRTECGGFKIDENYTYELDEFLTRPIECVIDASNLVNALMPSLELSENEYFKIRNGRSVSINMKDGNYSANYMDDLAFILKIKDGIAKSICYLGD
ncbi:MAG: tRNA pseudouridine(55) synthase TruB [Clostridia bacterium]|nr:tRNA pseudouridine(55) synthase TruB [Clostridia bacterium]MDE7215202.1 tRNA pseudouridine(55) synthase TruB [Clostridia bacterium]